MEREQLSDGIVAALASRGRRRSLTPGDVLCREGAASDRAFIVESGTIDVEVRTPDGPLRVATLGPGALVGEASSLVGGPRTATLRAATDGEVTVVTAAELRAWADEDPDEARRLIAVARARTNRTRTAAILSESMPSVDGDAVAALAATAETRHLAPGDALFERGDVPDASYVVLAGRLRVELGDDSDASRDPEVGAGRIVGELGLFDELPRAATVRAARATTVARIAADRFRDVLEDHPSLAFAVARRLLAGDGGSSERGSQARVIAVATTSDLDRRVLTARLVAELERHNATTLLSPAAADARLGVPGASAAEAGSADDIRIAELLSRIVEGGSHLVLECDAIEHPAWTARALATADVTLVVTSADPEDTEAVRIRLLLADRHAAIPTWFVRHHPDGSEEPAGSAAYAARFDADEVHHLREGHASDIDRLARLAGGHGVALVLGGGGARAYGHIGVVRAMEQTGIPIDRIVGASMGAVLGGALAQARGAEELAELVEGGYLNDVLDYTIPVVSLISAERLTDKIAARWGDADVRDLPIPFACVSTNLTTSRIQVHRDGPVGHAIRASLAIPGVMPPVPDGEDLLVDGGVLDNLPVHVAAEDPSIGTILAVDVAPARGPRAKDDYGLSVSGWRALRASLGKKRSSYPAISAILMRSLLVGSMHGRRAMLREHPVDVMLELDLRGVGLLAFDRAEEAIRRAHELALPQLQAFVGDTPDEPAIVHIPDEAVATTEG